MYDEISCRNNPVIIGQENSNVPNVIKLFADAFARSSIEVNSVVGQRMVLILKHVQVRKSFLFLQSNPPPPFFSSRQFHRYFKHV